MVTYRFGGSETRVGRYRPALILGVYYRSILWLGALKEGFYALTPFLLFGLSLEYSRLVHTNWLLPSQACTSRTLCVDAAFAAESCDQWVLFCLQKGSSGLDWRAFMHWPYRLLVVVPLKPVICCILAQFEHKMLQNERNWSLACKFDFAQYSPFRTF